MKLKATLLRGETAVAAFAFWQARDLAWAWLHSPYDRAGGPVFLLWLVPAVRAEWRRAEPARRLWLVVPALLFALAGGIAGINSLNYTALVLALGGGWPLPGKRLWAWLGLSLGWMPLLGWFGAKAGLSVWLVDAARAGLGLMCLAL
jgi:hypothetical protein